MKNALQKIGAILWVVSLVLLFLSTEVATLAGGSTIISLPAAWPCYLLLIAVGVIDLILVKKKEETITQWYRKFLPRKIDTIITIAVVVLFAVYHAPIVGLYILQGTIHGHLNGDW